MLLSILLAFTTLTVNVFGAVLTSTINVYYPFAHSNHRPASENGGLSYIGDESGVTTYLFTEPQTPGVTATFIEGEHVAVIIALNNPSFLGSYSCDVQVTQAVCLLVNIDPQNGGAVTGFTTDTPIDSLALLVVGLPGETPQSTPPSPSPTSPPPSSPSPSPSPSPPTPSNSPANQDSPASPTPKETTPTTPSQTNQTPQLSSSSQSSQSSQSSEPSPTDDSNGSNGLPVPAPGDGAPSQSSTISQTGSRPTLGFPSDNHGGDQNLLPGSGSTKARPAMANLIFLDLVFLIFLLR